MKTLLLTFLSILLSISLLGQSFENGLIAKYTFDQIHFQNETFVNTIGNQNDIQCYDISWFDDDPAGVDAAAIATAYPESTSYMDLNKNNELEDINELSSYTISFWTIQGYFANVFSGYSPILNIEDENGNAINLELNKQTKEVHLTHMENGVVNTTIHDSGSDVYMSGWYHVAITVDMDQGQLTLYLDGELIDQINIAGASMPVNPTITFGKYKTGEHAHKTTCFDDMYIHNRILNQEEIDIAQANVFLTSNKNILPSEDLKVYPNPSNGNTFLKVDFPNISSKSLVDIIDLQGKLIRREKLNNQQVDVSELHDGVYLLKIKTEEGAYLKKVILN